MQCKMSGTEAQMAEIRNAFSHTPPAYWFMRKKSPWIANQMKPVSFINKSGTFPSGILDNVTHKVGITTATCPHTQAQSA